MLQIRFGLFKFFTCIFILCCLLRQTGCSFSFEAEELDKLQSIPLPLVAFSTHYRPTRCLKSESSSYGYPKQPPCHFNWRCLVPKGNNWIFESLSSLLLGWLNGVLRSNILTLGQQQAVDIGSFRIYIWSLVVTHHLTWTISSIIKTSIYIRSVRRKWTSFGRLEWKGILANCAIVNLCCQESTRELEGRLQLCSMLKFDQ